MARPNDCACDTDTFCAFTVTGANAIVELVLTVDAPVEDEDGAPDGVEPPAPVEDEDGAPDGVEPPAPVGVEPPAPDPLVDVPVAVPVVGGGENEAVLLTVAVSLLAPLPAPVGVEPPAPDPLVDVPVAVPVVGGGEKEAVLLTVSLSALLPALVGVEPPAPAPLVDVEVPGGVEPPADVELPGGGAGTGTARAAAVCDPEAVGGWLMQTVASATAA